MSEETLAQTIEIVSAYVASHSMRPEDVPALIASTHAAVRALDAPAAPEQSEAAENDYAPAVTPRKSLADPNFIISLIDGKAYKTLRRHLASNGLTPEQYRERYKLKSDYPMVAQEYSETRRSLASSIGLGRKAKEVAGEILDSVKALVGTGDSDEANSEQRAAKPKRTRKASEPSKAPTQRAQGDEPLPAGDAAERDAGAEPQPAAEEPVLEQSAE